MGLFEKAREVVGRAVDEGRVRADDLRRRRERSRLMGELGGACYRQVKGDVDATAEVERLVSRIDDLDADEADDADLDLRASEESPATSGADREVGAGSVLSP